MKLLDTNIFIYATGRPHLYKQSCMQILRQAGMSVGSYAIDAELLQELLYVYDSRGERQRGLQAVDDILLLFPDPQPIGRAEMIAARTLMGFHPQLSPRDAIHAAVVLVHSLEGIVSADQIFDHLSGIVRFDPLSV